MLNIAMLVALGKAEELELHLGGAIRNGVTKKEIGEILLHSAIYCGYPAALGGFRRGPEVAAGAGSAGHDGRGHADPVVRDGRVDTGHLDRVDLHALAEREGVPLDVAPL